MAKPKLQDLEFEIDRLKSEITHLKATKKYGLVWTPKPAFQADVAWESYRMTGRDSVTSASAFPKAGILTLGFRYTW